MDELLRLRAERAAAEEAGLKWQQRGPPAECLPEGESTWRGQAYRPNTGKWANRGGAHVEWYKEFYMAKKAGPDAVAKFLSEHPHPKHST